MQGNIQALGVASHVRESTTFPETIGYPLGVAVLTTNGYLRAASGRIPYLIAPFDFCTNGTPPKRPCTFARDESLPGVRSSWKRVV